MVERDLLEAARVTLDHVLAEAHAETGELEPRGNERSEQGDEDRGRHDEDRRVLEIDATGGRLLLTYSEHESVGARSYSGLLVDPGTAHPVARLVFSKDTYEILQLTGLEGERIDRTLIPIDLPGAFASGQPVRVSEHRLVTAQSLRKVRESVDAVVHALFLIVPSLVLVLAAATWFTVGRALRPVHAISNRVAAISSTTLEERVPVPIAQDEIAELATLMNQMLDRLQAGSERQLQFVADASHELRSPLSTIRAAAEVAQISPNPMKLGELAGEVGAEAERMEALLSDLLELARLDEQRRTEAEERVDLVAVCQRAANRLPPGDPIVRLSTPDMLAVSGIESQIERAILNLLANAARHARSIVQLQARDMDGHAQVIVDDNGPGIDPEDRDRVFDRFLRLDKSRGRKTGGSGIGLSIVRAIAGRHGGSVYATEAPELGGARFVLDLGPTA